MCAKFEDEILGEFPIFLLIFCMGVTTVQCYYAACDNDDIHESSDDFGDFFDA